MNLAELNTAVARVADTPAKGSTITATDVSRVVNKLFDVLNGLPPAEAFDLVARGLVSAEKRAGKRGKAK